MPAGPRSHSFQLENERNNNTSHSKLGSQNKKIEFCNSTLEQLFTTFLPPFWYLIAVLSASKAKVPCGEVIWNHENIEIVFPG